jgi:hypothetical protein
VYRKPAFGLPWPRYNAPSSWKFWLLPVLLGLLEMGPVFYVSIAVRGQTSRTNPTKTPDATCDESITHGTCNSPLPASCPALQPQTLSTAAPSSPINQSEASDTSAPPRRPKSRTARIPEYQRSQPKVIVVERRVVEQVIVKEKEYVEVRSSSLFRHPLSRRSRRIGV